MNKRKVVIIGSLSDIRNNITDIKAFSELHNMDVAGSISVIKEEVGMIARGIRVIDYVANIRESILGTEGIDTIVFTWVNNQNIYRNIIVDISTLNTDIMFLSKNKLYYPEVDPLYASFPADISLIPEEIKNKFNMFSLYLCGPDRKLLAELEEDYLTVGITAKQFLVYTNILETENRGNSVIIDFFPMYSAMFIKGNQERYKYLKDYSSKLSYDRTILLVIPITFFTGNVSEYIAEIENTESRNPELIWLVTYFPTTTPEYIDRVVSETSNFISVKELSGFLMKSLYLSSSANKNKSRIYLAIPEDTITANMIHFVKSLKDKTKPFNTEELYQLKRNYKKRTKNFEQHLLPAFSPTEFTGLYRYEKS